MIASVHLRCMTALLVFSPRAFRFWQRAYPNDKRAQAMVGMRRRPLLSRTRCGMQCRDARSGDPAPLPNDGPRTNSAPQARCAAFGERDAVIARSTSCDEAIQPYRKRTLDRFGALPPRDDGYGARDSRKFHLTAFLASEVICPSCHCVAGAYACDDGQITGTSSRVSRLT